MPMRMANSYCKPVDFLLYLSYKHHLLFASLRYHWRLWLCAICNALAYIYRSILPSYFHIYFPLLIMICSINILYLFSNYGNWNSPKTGVHTILGHDVVMELWDYDTGLPGVQKDDSLGRCGHLCFFYNAFLFGFF